MGKKNKKKLNNVNKVRAISGNIKTVTAVQCYKGEIIPITDCIACEYHDKMSCTLAERKQKIEILPFMHPMMFNRNMFQATTNNIREDSVNYYFKTDIMNAVNNITDYPNYGKYKHKYIQGVFTVRESDPEREIAPFDRLSVMLFLQQTKEIMNCDIMLDGIYYSITKQYPLDGAWEIMLYLYNTFSLDGFADYKIMGVNYKATLKPVKDYPPDFIMARYIDKLVVGKVIPCKSIEKN